MSGEWILIVVLVIYAASVTYFLFQHMNLIQELRNELNQLKVDLLHK